MCEFTVTQRGKVSVYVCVHVCIHTQINRGSISHRLRPILDSMCNTLPYI